MSQRRDAILVIISAAVICALVAGCGPKPPQPIGEDVSLVPAQPTAPAPATGTTAPATGATAPAKGATAPSVEGQGSQLPSSPPVTPGKTAASSPAPPSPAPAKTTPATKAAPTKTTPPPTKSPPARPKPTAPAAKSEGTVVVGTIEVVSKIPDPSTLPYDTCVTFIKYKVKQVVSGTYDGDSLLAVFWGLRDGKLQPAARFRVGQSHRLTIEPFSEHEELARVMQADDTGEYSLTPYWVVSYTAE